ncbi:glycosyltransferase family 2 protein, partial [Campylobacter jejuni]|nr:glycosyltransferase family 2 protein [Campylobacter jejuni]
VLIKYLLYIQIYKIKRTKLMVTLLAKINILTLKILFKYKKFLKQC